MLPVSNNQVNRMNSGGMNNGGLRMNSMGGMGNNTGMNWDRKCMGMKIPGNFWKVYFSPVFPMKYS